MSITLIIFIYYLIISLIAFVMMFYDKKASSLKQLSKHRIAEKNLLVISLLGGCLGSLISMYLFRHKTKHTNFIIIFWFSLLLHVVILALLYNLVKI